MYIGDDLLIKVRASNPHTGAVAHTASTVTIQAYAPTKAPKTNPTDRAAPDVTITLTYDNIQNAHLGSMNTAGWVAGIWTFIAAVSGELVGHTYTTAILTDG